MMDRTTVAKMAYDKSPAVFYDKVDGDCKMSWGQALEDAPLVVETAYHCADAILLSPDPEVQLTKLAGKDAILMSMGRFTWFWGEDWLIETDIGNFHWKDPLYGGDNTFTLFEGTRDDFCRYTRSPEGSDKGYNLVMNKTGHDVALIIPSV